MQLLSVLRYSGTPVLLYQLPLHDRRLFASIPP